MCVYTIIKKNNHMKFIMYRNKDKHFQQKKVIKSGPDQNWIIVIIGKLKFT